MTPGSTLVAADDDPGMLLALRQLLEDAGYTVVGTAGDGEAALELIQRLTPDCAIVDLRMPGLTGLDVAEVLAQRGDPTPLILLSAFDDPQLQIEAERVGVVEYLVKGCPAAEIFKTIERCISRRRGDQPAR
jgi:DNA-binding NarL/FixJ family response regulator